MKRALHQAIVFFALLLIVTLVRLPYGSYRESVLPRLRSALTPQGITVDFADISLEPPANMLLQKLNLLVPVNRFPIPINIESANLSLRPLSLLRLHASGDGEVKLYQGTLNYDFIRPVFGSSLETNASLSNLSLSSHPLLGSFGLSGTLEGKFNGLLNQDEFGRLYPDSGTLSLALRNGAFQGGIKIFQLVQIPEIENISLVLQAQLDAASLQLSAVNLDSSLGTFSGKGKVKRVNPSQIGEGKLSGTLHLSELGKKLFGGYLALAAHSALDNPSTNWTVDVVFDRDGRPLATVAPTS